MVFHSNIWTHTIIINHNITSINTVNSNTVSVPKVFQSDIMSKKKVWTILFFRQKKSKKKLIRVEVIQERTGEGNLDLSRIREIER